MADFRLGKRSKGGDEQVLAVPESTLLGKVGSAVHTLGSVLSFPSRLLHGTINAATGGEGGFGNISPTDSTGGIEASRHLIRAGILSENDPSAWESSDVARGFADFLGDPTTWIGIGGLTKAGQGAAKAEALAKGVIPQIAKGQRALLTFRTPLGVQHLGELGTGEGVAGALTKAGQITRLTPALNRVKKSAPVRAFRGLMEAAQQGVTHPELQELMPAHAERLAKRHRAIDQDIIRMAREQEPFERAAREAGSTFTPAQKFHSALEGVSEAPAEFPHHVTETRNALRAGLRTDLQYGAGYAGGLNDEALKEGFFGPRFSNRPLKEGGPTLGAGSRNASAKKRKDFLKGFYQGTHAPRGVNDILRQVTELANTEAAKAMPRRELLDHLQAFVQNNFGNDVIKLYRTGPAAKTLKAMEQLHADIINQVGKKGVSAYKRYKLFTRQKPKSPAKQALIKQVADIVEKSPVGYQYKQALRSGTRDFTKRGAKNRYAEIAKYAIANSDLAERPLYSNTPLADVARSRKNFATRHTNSELVADALSGNIGKPSAEGGMLLRDALRKGKTNGVQGLAYRKEMAHRIAERLGLVKEHMLEDPHAYQEMIDGLLEQTVDPELVRQLKFARGRGVKTPAQEAAASGWQQALNLFKAGVLAFPSTRMRDLVSGGVQNVLHGWGLPGTGAYSEAARLMRGETLRKDYTHVPEVAEWLAKSGKAATAENQTEAVRQIAATHIPREHGFLGDLPPGQQGFELSDLLRNVPGRTPTTLTERFLKGPARAITQPHEGRMNPLAVRGVGGRTETEFGPVLASERFAEAGDTLNRSAGLLAQMQQGATAGVAAKNVNRAQIDYNPALYSDTEKFLKRNFLPFYSYASRILPATAHQIADLGSPTSQLIKAQDRAYGGNPAIPDYILDSSGTQLSKLPDNTLRYLTGLGLMHEPAVKMLGQGLLGAETGNFRPAALNVASQFNPFITAPIEHATGVSFSREGEPLGNLESNSGRTLANLAEIARLREAGGEPVEYPGRSAVDFLTSMTPIGRLIQQTRMATDTRKGPGKILSQVTHGEPIDAQAAQDLLFGTLPLTSGIRVTDVSPKKQVATLRKRAEELAASEGARERTEVYFPKEMIARVEQTDPEKAAQMAQLQKYINSLKARPAKKKKDEEDKGFRLGKR